VILLRLYLVNLSNDTKDIFYNLYNPIILNKDSKKSLLSTVRIPGISLLSLYNIYFSI